MRYEVLGPVAAYADEGRVALGGPKQRLVLSLLLADAGRSVGLDRMIDQIWGDHPPDRARHTLQAYISELRALLPDAIEWTGHGYRLSVSSTRIDAARFERLVEEGRNARPEEPARATTLLREALELWRGEPYADLQDMPALEAEAQRLTELRLAALEERIEADLTLGHHRAVVDELDALTREHPFRERFRAQQMVSLYRCGRQAEALRAFHKARRILSEELGVDPSPELQRLELMILQQDPALDPPPPDARLRTPRGTIRGFEVRDVIGEGSASVVYRAFQPSMGREVAVKALRAEIANDPEFVRRFEADAQFVARLEHPHIVALYDFWRDPEGAYLVMPLLRGGDVARANNGHRWSIPGTLRLIEQLGSALAYAHRQDVVHGRVTPTNVLLDEDANAYLADFRVATLGRRWRAGPSPYLAPEARGDRAASVEADIYALGVLTYRLLGGLPPDSRYPSISQMRGNVPADVDEVLARATARRPADRYSRVDDLTRDLRRAIGVDVVSAAAEPAAEPATVRNPYKGLRAFQETDSGDFFGRDDVTGHVVEALRQHRLVAVVGPSGCGKSSLVRAGVIPSLRAGGLPGSATWLITDMFPGAYPFEELGGALTRVAVRRTDGLSEELTADARGLLRVSKHVLPRDDSELLLVIDQFEELFSIVTDGDLQRLFLDNLAVVASDPRGRVRVLITLRADYFDRPLGFHRFGALMEAGLVPVAVPSEAGIALAVSRPAQRVGAELEPGLIPEVIRDVENQPGGLPLLQYALTELFERRQGRLLTLRGYVETGGVMGALGRRAEDLFAALSDVERGAAEQLFLRLVTVDERSEFARRRVLRSELAALDPDSAALDRVLQQFGAHRLLTFDRDPVTRSATVELAHEALLREWARLRGWIEVRREDLLLHRRLTESMREWEDSGRDTAFLLPRGRLDYLASWASRASLTLTTQEWEFLAASRRHEEDARWRRRRRRWALVAVLTSLSVIALAGAATAFWQAQVAQVRALTAAANSQLASDPELALVLAIEATDRARLTGGSELQDATGVLHEALLTTPVVRAFPGSGVVAWSTETNLLATLGDDAVDPTIHIRDGDSAEEVAAIRPDHGPISGLAWSRDGSLLAITHQAGPAVVWDVELGEAIAEIPAHRAGHLFPSFGAADTLLALSHVSAGDACCRSDLISIWSVGEQAELLRLDLETPTYGTHLSPVEPLLLVSQPEAHRASVWDARSGRLVRDFGDQGRQADFVRFSPDGRRAAVMGSEGMNVWDVATGTRVAQLPAPLGALDLEWSPDGRLIATSGTDALVRLVDVASQAEVRSLAGARGTISNVEFGPNGRELAALWDEIRIWDLQSPVGMEVATYRSGRPSSDAAWTPNGDQVVLVGSDDDGEAVDIFDATTRELVASVRQPNGGVGPDGGPLPPPAKLAVSPDGRLIAATLGGARTVVIDAATLRTIQVLQPGGTPGSFSPDSRYLVVGDFRAAYIYETAGWSQVATLRSRDQTSWFTWYYDVEFHPDGNVIFVADSNGERRRLSVWDVSAQPELIAELPLGGGAAMVSLSADGRRVAAGDLRSGLVRVWDVAPILAGRDPGSALRLDIDAGDFLVGAVLSPDGAFLATALGGGELAVWDVDDAALLYAVSWGEQLANEPEFSADGARLLVSTLRGVAYEVALDLDDLLRIARSRLTRALTDQECRIYLGSPCAEASSAGS